MSICNLASDGVPGVLPALYYTLDRLGPIDYDELLDVCAPRTLTESNAARETLNRWSELGLFAKHANGSVEIATEHKMQEGASCGWREHLKRQARLLMLARENNEEFWVAETNRCADFTRALSWLLSQDAYGFDVVAHAAAERLQRRQLGERKVFTNDVRWQGVKKWATYLGFVWTGKGSVMQLDPARAIGEHVRGAVANGPITIQTLRRRLSEQVPVLDGGVYQQEVRQHFREDLARGDTDQRLSTALSRALLTLEARGVVKLESKADAEGLSLQCPELRVVTDVAAGRQQ